MNADVVAQIQTDSLVRVSQMTVLGVRVVYHVFE